MFPSPCPTPPTRRRPDTTRPPATGEPAPGARLPRVAAAALAVLAGLLWASDVDAQVAVFGSSVREDTVGPGQQYTGVIRIGNLDPRPRSVRIYLRDYRFAADGRNWFLDPGSHGRSNAPWITISPRRLRLPPGEEGSVSFTVRVPDTLRAGGTYWSTVMVEPRAPGPGDPVRVAEAADENLGVATRVRYAVQIATNLPGGGDLAVDFRRLRVTGDRDRGHALTFDLHNQGELGIRPRVTLELYDGEGRRVAEGEEQRGLLYPGTSLRQTFRVGGLGPGTYQAVILVDPGGDRLFGGQYEVRIDAAGQDDATRGDR